MAWTQRQVPGPSARWGAAMAPLGGALVLFGGFDEGNDALSDTWTWNGTAWTQQGVPGPPGRGSAVMSSLGGSLVLFGRLTGDSALSDSWTWNGESWIPLEASGPTARYAAAQTSVRNSLVLFGGRTSQLTDLSDTWTWDGTTWSMLDAAGLRRVRMPSWRCPDSMATPSLRKPLLARGECARAQGGAAWGRA